MRILCVGLDGADYDLVSELLRRGRLPTIGRLARDGAFGPLRSTIPAFTPTAWSSFLTGRNPGNHGIFGFRSESPRSGGRLESAATRGGSPLWRMLGPAGIRSAYVTVPFTYPAEAIDGVVVTGFGGPNRPEITPLDASATIFRAHPELAAAPNPAGWDRDYALLAERLIAHVDQIADVCFLVLELEPDLGLLCVDFMSSDVAGHLMWHRLDTAHPAHAAAGPGHELVEVYEAVDRACGALIEHAEWLYGEDPTVVVLSDHGMKPTHWLFRANRWLEEAGYLRYRPPRRGGSASVAPDVDEAALLIGRPPNGLPELTRTEGRFAEIDVTSTHAACLGYGGQIHLGKTRGAKARRFIGRLAEELAAIAHPETGEPAFDVRARDELFHGAFIEKAPDLVLLPRDERVHVDLSRRRWGNAFERNDGESAGATLFSGQHALTGILAAAGPRIRPGAVPPDSEITQLPATLLSLHGLRSELDAGAIEAIVEPAVATTRAVAPTARRQSAEHAGYSAEEEAEIVRRLRDLGYE